MIKKIKNVIIDIIILPSPYKQADKNPLHTIRYHYNTLILWPCNTKIAPGQNRKKAAGNSVGN